MVLRCREMLRRLTVDHMLLGDHVSQNLKIQSGHALERNAAPSFLLSLAPQSLFHRLDSRVWGGGRGQNPEKGAGPG